MSIHSVQLPEAMLPACCKSCIIVECAAALPGRKPAGCAAQLLHCDMCGPSQLLPPLLVFVMLLRLQLPVLAQYALLFVAGLLRMPLSGCYRVLTAAPITHAQN